MKECEYGNNKRNVRKNIAYVSQTKKSALFSIPCFVLTGPSVSMPNVFAKYCQECYSKSSRVTPLLKPKQCLENHTQYICGTCGRCVCIEQDAKRGVKCWNFPFKTLEIAKLYLRAAEQCCQSTCGIYEIKSGTGRKSYKIFASQSDLLYYLSKNKKSSCSKTQPLFENSEFKIYKGTSVRKLTSSEVVKCLKEMKNSPNVSSDESESEKSNNRSSCESGEDESLNESEENY